MDSIEYKGSIIYYSLERKKRKTISIRVTEKCEVMVSAPLSVDDKIIKDILVKRWDRIHEMLQRRIEAREGGKFRDGDNISLLGREYPITFVNWDRNGVGVELNKDHFCIYVASSLEEKEKDDCIKAALREWYIKRAKGVFRERVIIFSDRMKLYPRDIRVRGQKSRWGSCSSSNNLNFNYKLLLAPQEVLDYVVVHELSHIRHKNHSKEFWGLVEKYIPNYREKHEWLKEHGYRLGRLE